MLLWYTDPPSLFFFGLQIYSCFLHYTLPLVEDGYR